MIVVLSLFKIALILSAPLYAVSKLSYVIYLQNSDLITLTSNVTTQEGHSGKKQW